MSLANLTAVCNLALDQLGEPSLANYATDVGATADAVRVHLPQAVDACLDSFDWVFATRWATLATGTGSPPAVPGWSAPYNLPAGLRRILRILSNGSVINDYHLQSTWVYLPSAITGATIEYLIEPPTTEWPAHFTDAVAHLLASRLAPKITQNPVLGDALLQKHELSLAKARKQEAIALHAKQNLGEVENMALDLLGRGFLTDEDLNRGITYDTLNLHRNQCVEAALDAFPWTFATRFATLTASAGTLPGWASRFTLPVDFQRVIRVERGDMVSLPNDYHVQGGYLYLPEANAAAPVLHYISADTAESEWSPLFKEAVILLLASRIAPKLSADPNLSTALQQKFELAMAKAKAKDAVALRAKANLGEVGNMALDMLGRAFLTAEDFDSGVTYDAVNLHLEQCKRTLLEGHVWSFATRNSRLTSAVVDDTAATLTTGAAASDNALVWTAKQAGPSGNSILVTIAEADAASSQMIVVTEGTLITVTPPGRTARIYVTGPLTTDGITPVYLPASGLERGEDFLEFPAYYYSYPTANVFGFPRLELVKIGAVWIFRLQMSALSTEAQWWSGDAATPEDADWAGSAQGLATGVPGFLTETENSALHVIAAVEESVSAAVLVTVMGADGSDGSGVVGAVTSSLTGGDSVSTLFAPAFGSAFNLPDDCLRLVLIDGADIDIPRNDFEIQGRYLLLQEPDAEAPVIRYITANPPEIEWPSTFKEALVTALAVKLAGKLAVDPKMVTGLMGRHEMALGKARSKDARETRSKENHGPRQLAARSGLVRARYGNPRPPY
jgi:hypothetical protein